MSRIKSLAGRRLSEGERRWVVEVTLPGLEHLGFRPWGAYKTQDDASRTKRRLEKRGLHSEVRIVDSREAMDVAVVDCDENGDPAMCRPWGIHESAMVH